MGQIIGGVLIVILSAVNYVGVNYGKAIQNSLTLLKIGTISAIIIFGLAIGNGTTVDFSLNPAQISLGQLIIGFSVALVAVSWAFDGWTYINFVAGEIKNPKRNLPLSLFLGTLILTTLYVLVNYLYLYALPIGEMAGVVRIAEKAATVLFGGTAPTFISIVVMISIIGALNGSILAGPRIYYAMSKDGLFFKKAATVHPRYNTPGFAIIIQTIWSIFLAISGRFEQLFTFVMFIAIIMWISAAASVFTLRKKRPDLPRPYQTWGYPAVPIIFIIASLGILITTLIEKPVESLAGVALTALGIPVFYYWKKLS